MELFKELLGFAVLTGPLWLILLWLPLAVWLAVKIARRAKPGGARFAAGAGVFVLVFLVPFADELVGRLYFSYLCATQAGVKVYQTVELPGEYWDEEGRAKYLGANGFVDMKLLPGKFEWRSVDEPYISAMIKIEKWRWEFVDMETKAVLGEKITFVRHYGWLNQFSPSSTVGESCRDLRRASSQEELLRREREQEQTFFSEILKPATSSR